MKSDKSSKESLKIKRKRCGWDDNYAAKVLWENDGINNTQNNTLIISIIIDSQPYTHMIYRIFSKKTFPIKKIKGGMFSCVLP